MNADKFLQDTGWSDAARQPIAGDASARRYTRLTGPGGDTRILMEDPEGDVAIFARLARHLRAAGLSAPEIHAEALGFLLIEDLGDALFAQLAAEAPDTEKVLYRTAMEALAVLHRTPPPRGLVPADPARLSQMTDLAFTWYLPRARGAAHDGTAEAGQDVIDALQDALARHAPDTDVMILRDFHAENLLWLPGRTGAARAGLLDFQDAMAGHAAYDIVSLLQDARRDVGEETRAASLRSYLDLTGRAAAPFEAALAVQGAARNLRILGIFARLAATRGKPHYVDLIPRVWGHLMRDLSHPALASVAPLVTGLLPHPDAQILARLKRPCPTP